MGKIYDWLLKLFARLEELEEEKTVGQTTHQFRQAIAAARDQAREYTSHLKREFMDTIDTIEGKRVETTNIMKEIEKAANKITKANLGRQQASWIRKLRILKSELQRNKTAPEEEALYEQFLLQLFVAKGTEEHMKELFNVHGGDAERELLKALKEHGVDVLTYHSGVIVGNQCMTMAKKGKEIMESMMKGMLPKIRDASNRKYLKDTCDHMQHMLNL